MRAVAQLMLLLGLTAVSCSKSGTDASAEATKAEAPRKKSAPAQGVAASTPGPLPPLDTKQAADGVRAVTTAPARLRPTLATKALVLMERDRLGAAFVDGLDAMVIAAPEQRPAMLADTITGHIDRLDLACEADATKTMESLAMMPPEQRTPALWDACDFGQHGLLTRDEAEGADGIALALAHMAYAHLATHGPVHPDERALLKALAMTPAKSPF